jgi:hypothetical protein
MFKVSRRLDITLQSDHKCKLMRSFADKLFRTCTTIFVAFKLLMQCHSKPNKSSWKNSIHSDDQRTMGPKYKMWLHDEKRAFLLNYRVSCMQILCRIVKGKNCNSCNRNSVIKIERQISFSRSGVINGKMPSQNGSMHLPLNGNGPIDIVESITAEWMISSPCDREINIRSPNVFNMLTQRMNYLRMINRQNHYFARCQAIDTCDWDEDISSHPKWKNWLNWRRKRSEWNLPRLGLDSPKTPLYRRKAIIDSTFRGS